MGILLAGLVGQIRKKAGNFVFSNWKGINTARAYAKPANPNTAGQQAQRTKFKNVIKLASLLLPTLIATFWNPFASMMSGFNAFVKSVFENVSSTGLIEAACKVTKGTLEALGVLTATYSTATGAITISWDDTPNGNGLTTDAVSLLIINKTNNSIVLYNPSIGTRFDGSFDSVISAGLTATDLVFFIWASRGTGSEFMVSDSSGDVASA